ncbi:MAG TPA: hypothetical protein VF796_30905, partial [Humisphaera sp.]
ANQAKIVVQPGGTLDPGNYVALGSGANTNLNPNGTSNGTQNLPYALPSPVNGQVTVEAGGRFVINDTSGIGSAPIGAWTMRTGSILDLGSANAFFGRGAYGLTQTGTPDTTGLIQDGQFAFEPGVIVRIQADNIYRLTQFMPGNALTPVIEIFNGNRSLTSQNNPFIVPVVGTATIAPEDVTISSGTMLTNDTSDRQVNEGRGRLVLGNGAVLAGTTQTYLNVQEGIEVQPNATVTIGSTATVDGVQKMGGVQLTGPNSNLIPASATINILDGAQLAFGAANVWPDTLPLNLPTAVTAFPTPGATTVQPANGTSLLLNGQATVNGTTNGNFTEIVGPVTGNGAIIANQAGAFLGVNATSSFTTNVVFKNTNGQQANLVKLGTGKMTMTGVSDSTGVMAIAQGELALSGTGRTAFAENRLQKGGLLTLDNTGTPLNDRLGGNTKNLVPMGGAFNLIGHATTNVTENLSTLTNSAGNFGQYVGAAGYTTVNVTPTGTGVTTLNVGTLENFQSAGVANQRSGTWVLRSATLGNQPGTYASGTGLYVPNPSAVTNGLIQTTAPNFASNGGFGIGFNAITGQAGSTVAPTRPDYLGDVSANGQGTGFVTIDALAQPGLSPLTTTVGSAGTTNGNTTVSINSTGLTVGMGVTGPNIPAGTVITAIPNGTSITISQNASATATGSTLSFYTPSTTVNGLNTANLAVGMPVAGANIPANTFITAVGAGSITLSNAAAVTNSTVSAGVNGIRLLTDAEYAVAGQSNANTNLNVRVPAGTSTTLTGDARIATLTLTPGSTVNINGTLPQNASASRLQLNTAGVLVQAGGTATINGEGPNNFLQ